MGAWRCGAVVQWCRVWGGEQAVTRKEVGGGGNVWRGVVWCGFGWQALIHLLFFSARLSLTPLPPHPHPACAPPLLHNRPSLHATTQAASSMPRCWCVLAGRAT